jgi:hypothetical protein
LCETCFFIDGTPNTIHSLFSPRNILALFPQGPHRFIAILRDPLSRALSQWRHATDEAARTNRPFSQQVIFKWTVDLTQDATFEGKILHQLQTFQSCASRARGGDLWETCAARAGQLAMITKGLYDLQLEFWFRFFPQEKFCVVDNNLLRTAHGETLSLIFDFLGLSPLDPVEHSFTTRSPKRHKYELPPLTDSLKDTLNKFFNQYNVIMSSLSSSSSYLGCQGSQHEYHPFPKLTRL